MLVPKKTDWTRVPTTIKSLKKSDVYIIGDSRVRELPGVHISSNIKNVEVRLITAKGKVLKKWKVAKADDVIDEFFNPPLNVKDSFWAEVKNPSENEEAVVRVEVHGVLTSRRM